MALTTSMTIPIRGNPSAESITSDPVYKALYANNDVATTEFLIYRSPQAVKTCANNTTFVHYVQEKEPGPRVDYDGIRTNLAAMRSTMSATRDGKETLVFFKNLLQLRSNWTAAALQFYSFEIYYKMIKHLVQGPGDLKFVHELSTRVPAALEVFGKSMADIAIEESLHAVQIEWNKFNKQLELASENLYALKVSDRMWHHSGRLHEAAYAHGEFMQRIGKEQAQRRKERAEKRHALKSRNTRHVMRQMGMLGTKPFPPSVCSAVEEGAKDQRNMFFSYPEEDCITPSYVKQAIEV